MTRVSILHPTSSSRGNPNSPSDASGCFHYPSLGILGEYTCFFGFSDPKEQRNNCAIQSYSLFHWRKWIRQETTSKVPLYGNPSRDVWKVGPQCSHINPQKLVNQIIHMQSFNTITILNNKYCLMFTVANQIGTNPCKTKSSVESSFILTIQEIFKPKHHRRSSVFSFLFSA